MNYKSYLIDCFRSKIILWLSLLVVTISMIYLFQGAEGNLQFITLFRVPTLAGLVITSVAIGISTLLFQTLSNNRILTPSLMGFDSMYVLMQTSIVFFFSSLDYVSIPSHWKFISELLIMTTFSVALFSTLLSRIQSDFSRMILTGIIFGILFRSLSGFMARVMSPNDYFVVQSASYARFNNVDDTLIPYAAVIVLISLLIVYPISAKLDVMALGRDTAIGLGVNHDKSSFLILTLVAVLVATATALVGPVVFLGLLISSVVYQLSPDQKHITLIPLTLLVSVLVVVGGQLILERLLHMQITISVVIELVGGLVFLYLILKR